MRLLTLTFAHGLCDFSDVSSLRERVQYVICCRAKTSAATYERRSKLEGQKVPLPALRCFTELCAESLHQQKERKKTALGEICKNNRDKSVWMAHRLTL